jgi:GxxExxY protein
MTTDMLYEELTYKVRGAIFKVYNTLGFGHKEGVYSKALAIEFEKEKIPFKTEHSIDVLYEGQKVGKYRPDFIVDDSIIIELKAIPFMGRDAEVQMVYYLKGTKYKLGLLVNFGSDKLDIKRKIWSGSA